jgi:hypothetical protein
MIPSIATSQAALQRHADFRREAIRAGEPGEPGRVRMRRHVSVPWLRWSVARPRPA